MLPLALGVLRAQGATLKSARKLIQTRNEEARLALRAAYDGALVLAVFASSPRRALAFRPRFADEMLALAVHRDAMEILGWEALGSPVKLFSIFSVEAVREAEDLLLPSRLSRKEPERRGWPERGASDGGSPFSVGTAHLIEALVRRILSGRRMPLNDLDYLILGCVGPNSLDTCIESESGFST